MDRIYSLWNHWQWFWIRPWSLLLWLMPVLAAWSIRWRRGVIVPAFMAYAIGAHLVYSNPMTSWGYASVTWGAYAAFVCFLFYCQTIRGPAWEELERFALSWAGIWACGCVLWMWVQGTPGVPILLNRSMAGVFIVLALAGTDLFWLAGVAAVILGRTTPIAALVTYWVMAKDTKRRALFLPALAGLFYYLRGIPSDTGRFAFWRTFWHWMRPTDVTTWAFGYGMGTMPLTLPVSHYADGHHPGDSIFIWMHNDFYQAFTEFGVVGIALLGVIAVQLFRAASREQRAWGAALAVSMFSDMPWHWVPQIWLCWRFVRVNGDSNKEIRVDV